MLSRIKYIGMCECNKSYFVRVLGVQLLIIIFLCITSLSCSQKDTPTDKIHIVVSILPLVEFTEKIGGDKIQVSVMVPPGASPHSYEPTPGQFAELNKAQLYVKVGAPIDFELVWLEKILAVNQDLLLCDASQFVRFIKGDPHIWLSPHNAAIMVGNIYDALIKIDPDNQIFYDKNKKQYIKELNNLTNDIVKLLRKKKDRKFMVFHPAWGYFARAYDLKQIPIEKQGKEPTAQGILRLIEQAEQNNIKVVFASPQFNTKSAKVIAKEIQGQVILIDPLEKEYIANLKKITSILVQVME